MLTKTQELIQEDIKLILVTATEDRQEVAVEGLDEMVKLKQSEISYVENEVRVAEQRLVVLQAKLTKLQTLAATAAALRPKTVEKPPIEEDLGK